MSAMVSERPSCISVPVSMIVSPPSWRMPTSKDTRVRVDGLSKIMASTLPSSGFERSPALSLVFRATASSSIERRSPAETADRSVKWRTLIGRFQKLFRGFGRNSVGQALGAGANALQRLADLRVGNGERRQEADDIVARRHGKQVLVAQRHVHLGVGHDAFQAEHQAGSPDALDDVGKFVRDPGQSLFQKQRLALHVLEETVGQHHVEHGVADRHRQRIAAEGGAVHAGGHAGRRLVRGEAGAHREAAADALGDRHQVGRDAGPLMREQFSGAADAALDLVEDQKQAVLVAQLAQPLQGLRRHRADAALALHRLDQDCRGLRRDRLFGRVDVVECDLVEALDLRAEAFEIFVLAAGGDRRERAAVEGALESDDAETLRVTLDELVAPGRLDGAFQRLGARIGEEHLVGESRLDQPLAQPALFRDFVEIGDVPEVGGLLGERRDQMRMAVAERIHRDAAREVKISLALVGDQPSPFPTLKSQGCASKGLVKRRTAHYMRLRNRKSKKPPMRRPLRLIMFFGHEVNENVTQKRVASPDVTPAHQ
ncbi:hypothetical protein MPL3365_130224 [Mesorhizobium plurifarium]|uniref:Uncharacterized protein n=2 Tax=Mesorhizobium plurifarium TaxID=69974 RepID=A0A090FW22_MESPL|nr:hypothetical protein MPL3365_130224 [Mesorhizobium plurifarium]